MAWETLKAYIDDKIRDKLPTKISADNDHNPTLHQVVDTFGLDYIYSGVASLTTTPINDDKLRYYIASGSTGTYVNFLDDVATPLELNEGEWAIFRGSNNIWVKNTVHLPLSFEILEDTPSTYAGSAGFSVVVNATEDGLEFIETKQYTQDEKEKLDGVETGATADQLADEVPISGYTKPASSSAIADGDTVQEALGKLEAAESSGEFTTVTINGLEVSRHPIEGVLSVESNVSGTVLQVGLEDWTYVYNGTGSTITNLTPVYISGEYNNYPSVSIATNTEQRKADGLIGLATHDIPNGTYGYVTSRGLLRDVDTSSLVTTSATWLGDGDLTNTTPRYPYSKVVVGGVLKVGSTDGIFMVGIIRKTEGNSAAKSYTFTSNGVSSGEYFLAGFYDAPAADANLTDGSISVSHGSALNSYAAHPFIVAGGAGSVTGTGQVGLRVTGTSINDSGTRVESDTDVITDDITTLSLNQYAEAKKYLGAVTFELYVVSGTPTAYSLDFNYGYSKYEDFGNLNFSISLLEFIGLAGANDAAFDIEVFKHSDTGWTYSATAFDPVPSNGGLITSLTSVHEDESSLVNGENFAFKYSPTSEFIEGSDSEGVVMRITTGTNNSVQFLDCHIGVSIES